MKCIEEKKRKICQRKTIQLNVNEELSSISSLTMENESFFLLHRIHQRIDEEKVLIPWAILCYCIVVRMKCVGLDEEFLQYVWMSFSVS